MSLRARKRNCETVEIESHDQTEKATIGPVEALTDVNVDETIGPTEAPVDIAAASFCKEVMKSKTSSKKEMGLRIAKSNSINGDRSLVMKEHEKVLRLFAEVCNVPVHAN